MSAADRWKKARMVLATVRLSDLQKGAAAAGVDPAAIAEALDGESSPGR